MWLAFTPHMEAEHRFSPVLEFDEDGYGSSTTGAAAHAQASRLTPRQEREADETIRQMEEDDARVSEEAMRRADEIREAKKAMTT